MKPRRSGKAKAEVCPRAFLLVLVYDVHGLAHPSQEPPPLHGSELRLVEEEVLEVGEGACHLKVRETQRSLFMVVPPKHPLIIRYQCMVFRCQLQAGNEGSSVLGRETATQGVEHIALFSLWNKLIFEQFVQFRKRRLSSVLMSLPLSCHYI